MLDVISVENMRASDAHTIETLVESKELMHRAASGIYNSTSWEGHTAIFVGGGNNGGDGYDLACILARNGFDCSLHTVSDKLSADGSYYRQQAEELGIPIREFDEDDPLLSNPSTMVDCILGTGFHGTVRGRAREAIEFINSSLARIISVDINSGLNGETGEAEKAVISNLTVSIGFMKNGMFLQDAGMHIGSLTNVNIGIELLKNENRLATNEEFDQVLKSLDGKVVTVSEGEVLEGGLSSSDDAPEDLVTPVEKANSIARALGQGLLVTGRTTTFVSDGRSVVFLKPDWVQA